MKTFGYKKREHGDYVNWIVENNLIIVDHYHGISLYGAYYSRIINNTVIDRNSTSPGPPWIMVHDHKDGTESKGCLIRNNISPTISLSGDTTADHNIIIAGNEADLFVDYSNLDFHLKAGSPAIDAGNSSSSPEKDIEGNSRPQGTGIDIDAYEY